MNDSTRDRLRTFSDLVGCDEAERKVQELRILDGLLAAAVREKDWSGALRIFESGCNLLRVIPQEKK